MGTEAEEEEPVSKYMLLDRLFRFIETKEDERVNAVLAGYFSRVVCLLINRKQKQVVPYIFSEERSVVELLLKHVYSRSVAEVLNRLLNIIETNFDGEELPALIAGKKQQIVSSLIEQLRGEQDQETALNAQFILADIME